MHPIERLRFVARAHGAPQELLVSETAQALGSFAGDPSALVTACRRVVSRNITSGSMWWLCSRMLCALEPAAEARRALAEIEGDRTGETLAGLLPHDARVCVIGWSVQLAEACARRGDCSVLVVDVLGEGQSFARYLESQGVDAVALPMSGLASAIQHSDVLVLETQVGSTQGMLMKAASLAAAAVAQQVGVPVFACTGVGRLVPVRIWEVIIGRWDGDSEPWHRDEEIIPLSLLSQLVSATGVETTDRLVHLVDCPIAPELFAQDIT